MTPAAKDAVAVTSAAGVDFDDFYRREFDQQVRRAALIIGSIDLACDVVHDAFVGVYQRWATLEDAGGYLNRSVLNGCRDVHRRNSSRDRLFVRLVSQRADAASVDADDGTLADVISALPFNQRAAVVLRYYGGLSIAEIATQLDCPTGSVGPWIDRALHSMRKALS
jgi:RNA polymerase sigma factor (sigma-70 family)